MTKEGESRSASAEVIEPMIGTGTRLETQQSDSGFRKTVLGMTAAVATLTQELVDKTFAAATA